MASEHERMRILEMIESGENPIYIEVNDEEDDGRVLIFIT